MIEKLKSIPVKQQLILMICAISFLGLLLASVAFVTYDRYAYRNNLVQQATLLARVVASHSANAVAYNDVLDARKSLRGFGIDPSLVSACIKNDGGQVVAMYLRGHYQSPDIEGNSIPGVVCLASENFISRFQDGYLDLIQPILWQDSQKIGQLHLRVSLDALNQKFLVFGVVVILVVLLVSMVSIVLSSKVQAFISAPLLMLAQIANTINRFKDYSLRARTDRQDELGQLVQAFNGMLDTIELQNRALLHANEHLEEEVQTRTSELRATNRELEAFTYSVSHDLRSPLRSVDGFSAALLEDCGAQLDDIGRNYIGRIRAASQRMGTLIDSLLHLSRVSRQDMRYTTVNLTEMADEVVDNLRASHREQAVTFIRADSLMANGDSDLLRVVLENLLGNAWKYSSKVESPTVEFGVHDRSGDLVYFVRDNGAGFDMKYIDKLFSPFHRLHSDHEFHGLGIGLATVARIVHRHSGEIWAEAQVEQGATFYFTLAPSVNDY
ncbi:MAG TPA: ATP-binding protein [Pseudomonadales bacterium]|nr:ATP-binding protein [Pseudomonadales bacterium]